jgi:hypothetical protein
VERAVEAMWPTDPAGGKPLDPGPRH